MLDQSAYDISMIRDSSPGMGFTVAMLLTKAFFFFGYVSLSSTSKITEASYMEEEKSALTRGIPVLHNFRNKFDMKADLIFSFISKNLNHRHLNPFEHILFPVSTVLGVLKANERLDKLGNEYDEFLDVMFAELAPLNAARLVLPELTKYWEGIMIEFNNEFNQSPSIKQDPKNFTKKQLFDLILAESDVSKQIDQALMEKLRTCTQANGRNFEIIGSFLERAENILIETSNQIGNKKFAYKRDSTTNYLKKFKSLKASRKFEDQMKIIVAWNNHIHSQRLVVEHQATLRSECVKGIKFFVSSHEIDHVAILSNFIDDEVRRRLQSLCGIKTEDLPLPISSQIHNMKGIVNQFYSLDNVNSLDEDILRISAMHNALYSHHHLIKIGRKAYKYGILMRKEMLKIFNEYGEQIKKSLAMSSVKFGLASLPTTFFFDMLKKLKFEFSKYEEGIKSEIQKLETAELNEDTYPIIGKLRVDISLLERQIEFCRAKFLASIEHFQQKMASEIHELAQKLVFYSSNNENKLLTPFDSTNEMFEEYVDRTVPWINQAIKKLRKEHISQKSSTLISEDQVIPDIIPEDSKTKLVDITRNFLKEYLDYPLLCGLDQNNQNSGPSLVSKNEILVGTFNAEWLFPFPDSVNEEDVGSYIWGSERAAARHFRGIVEVIESINADILLLQEVQDCRVLSAIVDALKQKGITDYSAYLVPTKDVTLGHHLGILSRYKPTEVSFAENTISKNIFARFHFINENGEEAKIAIMGVHMIAGENEGKRNMQALSIASFLENNLQQDERLLIMGDMNDYDPRVRGHGPHSSCLEILSHSRNVLINPLAEIRGKTLRTQSQRGIVDHILGEKELNFVQPKIHSDLVWSKKGSVSDHAPVTAEILPFGVSADSIESIDETIGFFANE